MKRGFGKWLLFDASKDGGEGNGGGEGGSGGSGQQPAAQNNNDVIEKLKNLIEKSGGEFKAAEKLYTENYELRQEIRKFKESLQGFEAVGTVDAIKALQTENATLKRDGSLREVAEVAGVKVSVLRNLDKGAAQYEIVTGENGKTVIVREGETQTPFDDYAKREWGDFLPALYPQQQQQQQQRQPFIQQHAGGGAKPKPGQEALDAVKTYQEKQRQGFRKSK